MLGRHLQSISRRMIASMLMLLLLAAAASCFAEVMVHNSAATPCACMTAVLPAVQPETAMETPQAGC